MRNLKKVLALVLALAMVMTMFAGAIEIPAKATDYADTLTAYGQAAYDVLSTLGVVTGYPDDTVKGDANVTRSEMAAFVYRMDSGDVSLENNGSYYSDVVSSFSDSFDAWEIPYVGYASLKGIVAGYGDGSFLPKKNVTGVEAAKMVLVMLGYDAAANGLIGANWDANTVKLASNLGLFNGVSGTLYAPMTRNDVIVLLGNALYTDTAATGTQTLGQKVFDLMDITAVLVANDHAAIGQYWEDDSTNNYGFFDYVNYTKAPANSSRFVYRDYPAFDGAANYTGGYVWKVIEAKVASNVADLGKEYRILTTGYNGLAYPSNEIREVYGVIGESANATVTTGTRATVYLHDSSAEYTQIGTSANYTSGNAVVDKKNMVTDGAYNYSENDAGELVANLDATILLNGKAATVADITDNTARAIIGNSTAPVYYVDNNQDGTIDFLSVAKYTLGIVASVADDATLKISADNAVVTKKAAEYVLTNGDVAVGDYVVYYSMGDEFIYVKKLDTVTGYVSSVKGAAYTINGVAYSAAEDDLATARAKAFLANKALNLDGAEYTFIVDADATSNFIVDVLVNENTSYGNYALIAEWEAPAVSIAHSFYQPYIMLFNAEGKYVPYTVASIDGLTVYQYVNLNKAASELAVGDLVSYVVDGTSVHITTAESLEATDAAASAAVGTFYAPVLDMSYNAAIDQFVLGNGRIVNSTMATIFAMDTAKTPSSFRVYDYREFYGVSYSGRVEFLGYNTGSYNEVVAKAIVIKSDELPGTSSAYNGQIFIASAKSEAQSIAYDKETGIRTFVIPAVDALENDQPDVTFSTRNASLANTSFKAGYIYRAIMNDDGTVADFEEYSIAGTAKFDMTAPVQLQWAELKSFTVINGERMIGVDYGSGIEYITLADDAVVYGLKNLESFDFDGAGAKTYTFGTVDSLKWYSIDLGVDAYSTTYVSGIVDASTTELTTVIVSDVVAD